MFTRKSFLHTLGVLGSSLIHLPASAAIEPDNALQPLLANRKLENSYWYMGHLMSVLIPGSMSGSGFSLLRATERKGLEPPPHTHTREDESFVILEGEADYTVGDRQFRALPGDVMFLPKNIRHSFRIRTETLETLILLNPGGFESYFIEMGQPAQSLQLPPMPQGPPDIARLVSIAEKYGIHFARP